MSEKPLDVSVVIVSFNTRDLLGSCLRAVQEGTRDLNAEVFVVDNASRDGSADMVAAEFPAVRLLRSSVNLGFAAANNRAFRLASGRYVLLVNPDALPRPGAIRRAVEKMDGEPRVGAAGGLLVGPDGAPQPSGRLFPSPLNDLLTLTGLAARRKGGEVRRVAPAARAAALGLARHGLRPALAGASVVTARSVTVRNSDPGDDTMKRSNKPAVHRDRSPSPSTRRAAASALRRDGKRSRAASALRPGPAPAGVSDGSTSAPLRATGAVRFVDGALALAAGVVLLPLFALRALSARLATGRVFDRETRVGLHGREFERLAFAGEARGRSLPALWHVLIGELAWVGPRARRPGENPSARGGTTAVRPGAVSRYAVRAALGVSYLNEEEDDADFLGTATLRHRLGILLRAAIVTLVYASRPAAGTRDRFEIFGVPAVNTTMGEAVDWIVRRATGERGTEVAFVNPHCLNTSFTDDRYRAVLRECDRVFPDGSGIRLACRLRGIRLLDNVNGTDMFPLLIERLAAAGRSVFFLGAAPGIAAATADAMRARVPELRVAGVRDGYFAPAEEEEVVDEINRSGAAVLLVAMGVPQQELWIARHRQRLQVPVRIAVGGLFDFYSGRIARAPGWLRELGLEWCWRLWQEPSRLWRRYVVGNPLFLWRVRNERRNGVRDQLHAELFRLFRGGRIWQARRIAHVRAKRLVWRALTTGSEAAKRLLDVVVSGAALAALSPLFALVILLIRLDSPGPIFFYQTRVGRWGRPFRMYKFRSMYVDAEARQAALLEQNQMAGGVIFKMRNDPRITRVGRTLRKLSIDELPQLWHVLRGEMSLVGPRPPLPSEVARYELCHRRRLDVTPGLTCIWQVSGRSEVPFARQVEMDVDYIESHSLWLDIKLLLRTIPAVLQGRGAF